MKNLNSKQKLKRKRKQQQTSSSLTTSIISTGTGNSSPSESAVSTRTRSSSNIKMDTSASEFIDYLSNVNNHNNQTGISEESLLLSPIFNNDADTSNITQQRGSSSKRLRSSARLKRRQGQERDRDYGYQYGYGDASSSIQHSSIQHGGFDLNQSIPEHDVFIMEQDSQVFSPLADSRGRGLTHSHGEKDLSCLEVKMVKEEEKKAQLLRGALDTSACPSLGLGSVGSSLDSNSNNSSSDISYASCQSGASEPISIGVNDQEDAVKNDNGNDHGNDIDHRLNSSLQDLGDNSRISHISTSGRENGSGNAEGISFDSSLGHMEESLHDSMEQHCHDDKIEEKEQVLEYTDGAETSSHNSVDVIAKTTQIQINERPAQSPMVSKMESTEGMRGETSADGAETSNDSDVIAKITQIQDSVGVTQSPMESKKARTEGILGEASARTPEREQPLEEGQDIMDEAYQVSTPTAGSNSSETEHAFTPTTDKARKSCSPSKSITKIRLGLTPRLKKLRSKMIRESLGGREGSSEYVEDSTPLTVENRNAKAQVMEGSTPPSHEVGSVGSKLSLTPALKSLRSKLYRDSMSVGDVNRIEGLPSSDFDSPGQEEMVNTPNYSAKSASRASSTSKTSDQLSLTPALKAFRMKLMNSTLSPFEDTPQSNGSSSSSSTGERQFLSPSLRPSTSTFATSGSSTRTRRVMFEEDDSYLEQPKDLSSAKKNLNAQSSALVERLRGAAHKRMITFTRSRDSLAAKESLHLEKLVEVPGHDEDGVNIEGSDDSGGIEGNVGDTIAMEPKSDLRITSKPVWVPSVQKRPATVPISPKLGTRRIPAPSKPSEKVESGVKSKSSAAKIMQQTTPISANVEQLGVQKVKRRPKTVPKSPLLGTRRKADDKQSSTKLKASDKKVYKSPSTSPVGLSFLSKTPSYKSTSGEENVAPFTLHSSIRAQERAEFEACRVLKEHLRSQEVKEERERLLNEKYKELRQLKEKLR